MPTHIAMLRGINVSGQKIIRMEDLRKCFESLGFSNVKTYVQSGNVVFDTGKKSSTGLSNEIETRILHNFGFCVPVFLRTTQETLQIIHDNPFAKEAGVDESKLHVTFLSEPVTKKADEILAGLAVSPERFRVNDREIHLCCPNGYGKTKLSNNAIEKKLGVIATTRNWKSVNALLALTRSHRVSP